ncbi:fatty acid desaturase [Streptomyces sp. VNUA116]|uniref:fatty acid desaturase n=1 Tax=Streptomyces sp. VNUA116 TaxID=3062449 RepID=UPI002676C0A4|nr:fatty acid desaturase [Streptomyces sp. VNUA116]WKU43319.1 fatty acid desaturase [Streptomyces sp. VNUA116]
MTVSATDRNAPDHGDPGHGGPGHDEPGPRAAGAGRPRTANLLHHRYSRTPRERTEVYDARTTTWAKAAPGYYARLPAAALAGRALVVSLQDNAYHYATPLDAPLQAMNLRLPRPLEAFALGFNLHGVHHRHPGLPWSALRARFAREGGRYDLGWTPAVARQLRGPVRAGR